MKEHFFDMGKFGKLLQEMRRGWGFVRVEDFAEEIEKQTGYVTSAESLKKLEQGKGSPSLEKVIAIAVTLGVYYPGLTGNGWELVLASLCSCGINNAFLWESFAKEIEELETITSNLQKVENIARDAKAVPHVVFGYLDDAKDLLQGIYRYQAAIEEITPGEQVTDKMKKNALSRLKKQEELLNRRIKILEALEAE